MRALANGLDFIDWCVEAVGCCAWTTAKRGSQIHERNMVGGFNVGAEHPVAKHANGGGVGEHRAIQK
jgi:hypothetical protein